MLSYFMTPPPLSLSFPSITCSFSFFLCLFLPFPFFLCLFLPIPFSLSLFFTLIFSLLSFILHTSTYSLSSIPTFSSSHNFFLINLGHKGLCDNGTILLHTTWAKSLVHSCWYCWLKGPYIITTEYLFLSFFSSHNSSRKKNKNKLTSSFDMITYVIIKFSTQPGSLTNWGEHGCSSTLWNRSRP